MAAVITDATMIDLYTAHRHALIDYASGIIGNRSDAEDLVQEARQRFIEEPRSRM